ncbi:MAG: hypothetical protein GY864_09175, partial [Desulfobacterales bacterium]|nr:hypothetical protein [Desulfobacterales bacterium]
EYMKQQKRSSHIRVPPDLAPPWRTSETWKEANQSVAKHLKLYLSQLKCLEPFILDIKGRMERISSRLDELCNNTCPWCPVPCCLSAMVWFDFPDLLFLHLSGRDIPPSQPKTNLKDTCCYLGPRGCRLPRNCRPWICTWYLCDTQLACLRKEGLETQAEFEQNMQVVKVRRKTIEEKFIRIVI